MKEFLFYGSIVSFLFGIFIRHNVDLGWSFLLIVIFMITVSIYFPRICGGDKRNNNYRNVLSGILIISFLFLGYVRLHISLNNIETYHLDYETFTGTVIDEPDVRENSTHYVVQLNEINTKVRITLGHYPILNYGDVIEIKGKFEDPENFENDNGIEFDYKNFLLKDGIQFVSYFPKINILNVSEIPAQGGDDYGGKDDVQVSYHSKISVVEEGVVRRPRVGEDLVLENGQGDPRKSGDDETCCGDDGGIDQVFKKKLFQFKSWFINNLNKSLVAPHSSLAAGILVGAKQSLGEQLLEDFRKVGLIHIVVLSGYNVTIIIDAIQKLLSFLPRILSFSLSIISIFAFAIFTGASATTIRASIMAILVVISRFTKRTYGVNRSLFFAGFLMVLHNPLILMSDPGFQLSFMATLGLLHISPKIEKILEKIKITDKFEIRQIIAATISTQLTVLPLLISMTGQISIVALLANLLVLPVIPISMAFGAISALTNCLGMMTVPIHLITFWLLEYSLIITEWLAGFSFATINFNF